MNDFQMTKLSHGHIHELRAEAHMARLAGEAADQRPSVARRIIGRIVSALADADERDTAAWSTSPHRYDAWDRPATHR